MSFKKTLSIFLLLFIVIACIIYTKIYLLELETHPYFVILKEDNIEVRNYPPRIVAKVSIQGERYEALQEGFKTLFKFINENNISMSTPVIHYKDGDTWVTEFIMPKIYTLKTLPTPKNPEIKIETTQSIELAAIIFSGRNTDENLQKHLDILDEFIQTHQYISQNTAYYAFYNGPWMLPILRHNEILVEIKER